MDLVGWREVERFGGQNDISRGLGRGHATSDDTSFAFGVGGSGLL